MLDYVGTDTMSRNASASCDLIKGVHTDTDLQRQSHGRHEQQRPLATQQS